MTKRDDSEPLEAPQGPSGPEIRQETVVWLEEMRDSLQERIKAPPPERDGFGVEATVRWAAQRMAHHLVPQLKKELKMVERLLLMVDTASDALFIWVKEVERMREELGALKELLDRTPLQLPELGKKPEEAELPKELKERLEQPFVDENAAIMRYISKNRTLGVKVLASELKGGDYFRKQKGEYVYLVISRGAARFYKIKKGGKVGPEWTYGVSYNGNMTALFPETTVVRATLADFMVCAGEEQDWNDTFATPGAGKRDTDEPNLPLDKPGKHLLKGIYDDSYPAPSVSSPNPFATYPPMTLQVDEPELGVAPHGEEIPKVGDIVWFEVDLGWIKSLDLGMVTVEFRGHRLPEYTIHVSDLHRDTTCSAPRWLSTRRLEMLKQKERNIVAQHTNESQPANGKGYTHIEVLKASTCTCHVPPTWRKDRPDSHALVVSAHGSTHLLAYVGADIDHELENVGAGNLLTGLEDGVWHWVGRIRGTDWPDATDYELDGFATKIANEDWDNWVINGEPPWTEESEDYYELHSCPDHPHGTPGTFTYTDLVKGDEKEEA